jgi:hypothetical protein
MIWHKEKFFIFLLPNFPPISSVNACYLYYLYNRKSCIIVEIVGISANPRLKFNMMF